MDVVGNMITTAIPYSEANFRYDDHYEAYKVTFDGLNATDMRTLVTAWVVDGNGAVCSNEMTSSIETYAANMLLKEGATYEAMYPLLKAMMKYGNSAEAYFTQPEIKATMIQPWVYTGEKPWDQDRWNKEFDRMEELGIQSLILQNVVELNYNEGYFYSIYPTEMEFEVTEGSTFEKYKQLELILKAAKSHGMTVYIGTVGDSNWFKYGTGTWDGFAKWSEANAAMQVAVMEEILSLYGNAYKQQIAGWYYHNEIFNANGFTEDATVLNAYTDALTANLNTVIEGAGNKPVMLSPYFNPNFGTAKDYAAWWRTIFSKVNFRQYDIFVPQDTVGADGNLDIRVDQWIAELSKVAREAGLEFWVNNECFRGTAPAPVKDFVAQYRRTDLYTKKHIVFSWNHYYNPELNPSYKTYHDGLKTFLKK
jgi:hypothetical protein